MKKQLAIISVTASLCAANANAEYIEAPNYPKGQLQINDSVGFIHGDEDGLANSLETTYGFTDRLAGVIAFNSGGGENVHYDYYGGVDLSAQINLDDGKGAFPATAWRFTYSYLNDKDTPDTISTMAVFEKKIGPIDNFLNVAFGKTIGDDAVGGTEFGVAAQTMYGLNNYTDNEEWAAGFEYFGDFGKTGVIQGFSQKGQQAGPIIGFQPWSNFQTSLNYMVGLTHNAPRSAVTMEFNLTF